MNKALKLIIFLLVATCSFIALRWLVVLALQSLFTGPCPFQVDQGEVQSISITHNGEAFLLNETDLKDLIEHIHTAKYKGPTKMIHDYQLEIKFIDGTTQKIRANGNTFKWQDDNACSFKGDGVYLKELHETKLMSQLSSYGIRDPFKTIENIFNTYNEYQESTDSSENLDSLKRSLQILERRELNAEELDLLINVWMYYTVTDFDTRRLVNRVLWKDRKKSKAAVESRMANKLGWETTSGAPFSELNYLLSELSDPQKVN